MIKISLPMVVSFACDTVMIFTDRLFLAKLGPMYMNASMGGGISYFLLIAFFLGMIGYVTALTAQYFGAQQKDKCSQVLIQAMIIIVAVYPLLIMSRPLADLLSQFFGVPFEQAVLQKKYLDILIYGAIFSLGRHALSCFFSGVGQTRHVMAASLLAMGVNVAANYCLVFGKCGLPALGIRGAAIGTIIASASGFLYLVIIFLSRKNVAEFVVARSFVFKRDVMMRLIRFGYPSGLEFALNILAFSAMIFLFHSEGPVSATAATIVFNWDMVTFIPLLGIEVGVTSMVGRYKGAGQLPIAQEAVRSAFKLGLLYALLMLVTFVALPEILVSVFRPDGVNDVFALAQPLAVSMIRWIAFYVLAEALLIVFIGALRGGGDTFAAMTISVGIHWIIVALLYVVLKHLHLGTVAAWITLVLTFTGLSILPYLRYRQGAWKNIKVIEG